MGMDIKGEAFSQIMCSFKKIKTYKEIFTAIASYKEISFEIFLKDNRD